MSKLLWKPAEKQVEQANSTRLLRFVNERFNLELADYFQLYHWSVENIPDFWAAMWDFGGVVSSKKYDKVVDDLSVFPGTKWFPGARLNYAENLLRCRDDKAAYIFKGEIEKRTTITYKELYYEVARLSKSLRDLGVKKDDRVVAYIPNMIETVIGMLAATSIGATWASCGAELGPAAVIDRLGQVEPKVLITADGYIYKGKRFDILSSAKQIVKSIPSIEQVIVVSYITDKPDISDVPKAIHYKEFLSPENKPDMEFEQVPFDHSGFIMFSSGTTGKPKSMVQSAGGLLLNQLKDLIIHTDLKREDRFCYLTTPSWMMWNFLNSSLTTGATLMLFDGNPSYPDWKTIWQIIQDEKITIFGCSASYVYYLRNVDAKPKEDFDLSHLRQISQTGSALSAEGFEYVYHYIKEDLHFNSITGGTDLNGTFASGTPAIPVYSGQIQAPALGMKVKAYDEKGNPAYDQQGELICEAPFPSMPIYFWDDENFERYNDAYFNFYKPHGKNVWRHGDYITYHSDTGGITVFGRSDALLKPSGVRIGTAEIYNVVEDLFQEIEDSVAIGQNWKDDQRILLFVKLSQGYKLTDELLSRLKKTLREKASPRHVPALIIETPDIPYTFSGKKVEIAITNIAHGREVTNRDALSNPESLNFYEKYFDESKE